MKENRRNKEYMYVNESQDNGQREWKKWWRKWMISDTWAQLFKAMESSKEK